MCSSYHFLIFSSRAMMGLRVRFSQSRSFCACFVRKLMARRMYLVQMCSRNFPRILNTVTSALTSVVMTFRSIVMIKPKTPNTKSMMVESRPPPPLGPPPKSGGQSNELGSQFSGILLVLAGLLLRERAQCPELLYARVDAA